MYKIQYNASNKAATSLLLYKMQYRDGACSLPCTLQEYNLAGCMPKEILLSASHKLFSSSMNRIPDNELCREFIEMINRFAFQQLKQQMSSQCAAFVFGLH